MTICMNCLHLVTVVDNLSVDRLMITRSWASGLVCARSTKKGRRGRLSAAAVSLLRYYKAVLSSPCKE